MEELVKKFNKKYMKALNPNIRMLDIQSEAGELAKEVIKAQDYGNAKYAAGENLELELGDLLYSVISFALENNINPKSALSKVIAKYEKRFKDKGNIGSKN